MRACYYAINLLFQVFFVFYLVELYCIHTYKYIVYLEKRTNRKHLTKTATSSLFVILFLGSSVSSRESHLKMCITHVNTRIVVVLIAANIGNKL